MRDRKVIILLVVFCLAVVLASLISWRISFRNTRKIPMEATVVKEGVGLNAGTDKCYFGHVPLNGTSERNLTLSHTFSYPARVSIKSEGNITRFLAISDDSFILDTNESREIKVRVSVPKGTETGKYEGTLKVIFRKPLLDL